MRHFSESLLTIAVAGPLFAAAQGDDYPHNPIGLIASVPAGGSTDVLTRDATRRLQERRGRFGALQRLAPAGR